MSTVEKAISLLELFTAAEPELGLSDIARSAEFDKATTRRLLMSLLKTGLVEQDDTTRRYRLGAGVSRLARLREAHFPFLQIAGPVIRALAEKTGETAHLSELNASGLVTVHVEESAKANRVGITLGHVLPLHATASGLIFLAFSKPDFVKAYLRKNLESFTRHTIVDRARLQDAIKIAADRGYSHGEQGFEDGVSSVAAPILGPDRRAIGTVAVASPLSRVNDTMMRRHIHAVIDAARTITEQLCGDLSARRSGSAS
jgi:DNA-binding IclR family transcriptional regulator